MQKRTRMMGRTAPMKIPAGISALPRFLRPRSQKNSRMRVSHWRFLEFLECFWNVADVSWSFWSFVFWKRSKISLEFLVFHPSWNSWFSIHPMIQEVILGFLMLRPFPLNVKILDNIPEIPWISWLSRCWFLWDRLWWKNTGFEPTIPKISGWFGRILFPFTKNWCRMRNFLGIADAWMRNIWEWQIWAQGRNWFWFLGLSLDPTADPAALEFQNSHFPRIFPSFSLPVPFLPLFLHFLCFNPILFPPSSLSCGNQEFPAQKSGIYLGWDSKTNSSRHSRINLSLKISWIRDEVGLRSFQPGKILEKPWQGRWISAVLQSEVFSWFLWSFSKQDFALLDPKGRVWNSQDLQLWNFPGTEEMPGWMGEWHG